MNVTVGGLLITSGIVVTIVTALGTLFVAFAYGMSDAPQDKMNVTIPTLLVALGIGMILVGKFSGL